MDSNTLSMTGVIATVLASIFAAAAMWNSYQRRKHIAFLEKSQKTEAPMRFRPAPALSPTASTLPGQSSLPKVAAPQLAREAPAKAVLFRQVRPGGERLPEDIEEEKAGYVWE
jgi:hypothetical protein